MCYNVCATGSHLIKGADCMVSSKELLALLRLLAQLTHEDKMLLLNYLSAQGDTADSSMPSVFSRDEVEE